MFEMQPIWFERNAKYLRNAFWFERNAKYLRNVLKGSGS